ncbi:YdcF family protein [Rickettsiales endosymbiont of Stachyamoeba lipophora]|uniref:YdcF family protein n=1 Tax=Rickettsiales endosymbiont of Stachyamoeba lipophora TaxID=2486578 RepID=UPI000F64BD37|nr:YdcF family protein [Rickettsiales endosymbiont of Stachyamoeba lipophora]AZL15967.1 YdcF family protein [Rickettsiales endosymbiont of Stachyamoeba lipophora]
MPNFKVKLALYFVKSLIFFWAAGFVIFIKYIEPQPNLSTLKTTEAIIILTGGTNRIYYGLKLACLDKFKLSKIFISGVGENFALDSYDEFNDLKKEEPACIDSIKSRLSLGKLATSTELNAVESSSWIEFNKINNITLVTSNYHLPRSLIEFKKFLDLKMIQKFPIKPSTLAINEWWNFPNTFKILFIEYNKFLSVLLTYLFR